MKLNRIIQGDCLVELKKLPENSIDLIATDPPYGIGFMGKKWDKFKTKKSTKSQVVGWMNPGMKKDTIGMTEFFIPIWKEALRVLKSGGFAFVMCSPRQDVLMKQIQALSEAGFKTGFTSIYWTVASGFPKSLNISKAIDKKVCKEHLTKKLHRKPTKEEFKEVWENFRKVIGIKKTPSGQEYPRGYEIRKTPVPFERSNGLETKAVSKKAKELDGSYTFSPKPAVEVILVVMKPLSEKSYTEQALKNKKGIVWFDDCRIPYEGEVKETIRGKRKTETWEKGSGFRNEAVKLATPPAQGRFPANLLVSDDILNDGRVIKSGGIGGRAKHGRGEGYGFKPMGENSPNIPIDSGSFSRYFSLDSWWEKKIKHLPPEVRKTFPFLIVPKSSKAEKNRGIEGGTGSNTYNRKCLKCNKWERKQGLSDKYTCHCDKPDWEKPKGNFHPTVKPIKLFSYLITLGSRKGDIILDPFVGSGTTCIASKRLKRKYIGIEKNSEYCAIARARVKAQQEPLL